MEGTLTVPLRAAHYCTKKKCDLWQSCSRLPLSLVSRVPSSWPAFQLCPVLVFRRLYFSYPSSVLTHRLQPVKLLFFPPNMQTLNLLLLAAVLDCVRDCAGSQTPEMQWDPDTVSSCIEWYNNYQGESCEYVRDYWKITPEQFTAWNPSVNLDCKPWRWQSYCIDTKERQGQFTSTATVVSTSTITTSTTTATAESSPSSWAALGCYSDILPMHILEKQVSEEGGDKALTIAKCQSACHLARLKYVGLKAGNECWCSSYVAGELAKNKTDCNTACSGDKSSICGGKDSFSVFEPILDEGNAKSTIEGSTTTTIRNHPLDSSAPRNFGIF